MATHPLTATLTEPKFGRSTAIAAAIVLVVIGQLYLVFTKSINWDEFSHFAEINRALQGRAVSVIQTPYVRLFGWVPALPGSEIDHIQLIRLLMFPFEATVAGALFLIVRDEVDAQTAAMGVLAYLTGGYVFLHGMALRSDMISAALLMIALALASSRPPKLPVICCIALLTGLATLSTIKSVFYFPAIAVALWLKLDPRARRWGAVAASIGTAIGAGFVLASPILIERLFGVAVADAQATIRSAGVRMFPGDLFSQARYLILQVAFAPCLAAITLLGLFCAAGAARHRMLIDISRFVPLLGVAFYFNAYPYHYAFVMPPAVAASAPAIRILAQRYGHILLLCLLLANAIVLSAAEDRSVLASQRTVLAGVHAIFPQPVTYIDESGMIGSFPRAVSHFASGWGLANYQTKGEPEYRHAADAEPIPLLLVNGGALAGVFDGHASATGGLLPADIQFLRENYIPHWGQLYVAGKQITASNRATDVEIVIPGHYTVEISPITIDGHRHAVGDMVSLARGIHVVAGPRQSDSVLRWGNHLPRPNFPWPQARLFTDF